MGTLSVASWRTVRRSCITSGGGNSVFKVHRREPSVYKHPSKTEITHIHVRFEEIFPVEDGNGRIGRLIMFKACLRHGTMPFIIDDKHWFRYLRGIKEWHDDRFEMIDVVMEAQDRFEAQIELQRLHAAGQFFAPVSYQESFDDEDE